MSKHTFIQNPDAPSSSSFPRPCASRPRGGVLAGAATCVMLVGVSGWLAGVGVLTIPGIARISTEGPGLAALCGVVVGGTIGGIAGCLVGRGIPCHDRPPK